MKKLHLLCNAHIDPVWLWLRKDGIAVANVALPALGRALTHSFGAYEIKTVDIGDPV